MSGKIKAEIQIKDNLARKRLIGKKSRKEEEIRRDLVRWHKNSNSLARNIFIGERKEQPA